MSYDINEFHQPVDKIIENWTPRQKPQKKIMQGRYTLLEPLEINKHAAALFEALWKDNQGELWTYLSEGPFFQLNEFQQWIQTILSKEGMLPYAILDIKTCLPVGICAYMCINPEHGVIEIGSLHYSSVLKKTPAATEAMYLMMAYIFDELKYRRYEWKCNALNAASRQAAMRLGFQFEGIFRQANVFKGRNRDTAWFSIIDSEWPDIKAKLEKWLDPANFDQNGRQIRRLNA